MAQNGDALRPAWMSVVIRPGSELNQLLAMAEGRIVDSLHLEAPRQQHERWPATTSRQPSCQCTRARRLILSPRFAQRP